MTVPMDRSVVPPPALSLRSFAAFWGINTLDHQQVVSAGSSDPCRLPSDYRVEEQGI